MNLPLKLNLNGCEKKGEEKEKWKNEESEGIICYCYHFNLSCD